MNDRVKEIRKSLGLTLEKFGERLGVTKTTISRIENGINNVTEQMRKSICREFNINEEWLKTGEGEMYQKTNSDISQLIDEIMKEENEFYIKIFKTFARLDNSELLALEKILDKYVEISTSMNKKTDKENYLDKNNIKELGQEYSQTVFNSTSNKDPQEQTATDDNNSEELSMTIEEAEAAYIKSRYNHVQKTVQSASNTFADTIKDPEKNINVKVSNQ